MTTDGAGDDRWAGFASWSIPARSDEPGPVDERSDEVAAAAPVDPAVPGPVDGAYGEVGSVEGWATGGPEGWDDRGPEQAAEAAQPVGQVAAGADAGGGVPGEPGPMAVAAERLIGSGGEAVAGVAAAVAALDELGRLPVGEHVRWYDALHGELSDALASIDEV